MSFAFDDNLLIAIAKVEGVFLKLVNTDFNQKCEREFEAAISKIFLDSSLEFSANMRVTFRPSPLVWLVHFISATTGYAGSFLHPRWCARHPNRLAHV